MLWIHQTPYRSNVATEELKECSNETEEIGWRNAESDEKTFKVYKGSNNKEESTIVKNKNALEVRKDPEKSNLLCIVVESNIFIKNVSKLKDILDMKIPGPI